MVHLNSALTRYNEYINYILFVNGINTDVRIYFNTIHFCKNSVNWEFLFWKNSLSGRQQHH